MSQPNPNAFAKSALLHTAVAGLAVLFTVAFKPAQQEAPKIFELVAGEGDNYGATEAPALGVPGGIKFNMPAAPQPSPVASAPEPESPVQPAPEPPSPVAPTAPEPTPPKPKEPAKPTPAPKQVNLAKMIDRVADRKVAVVEKKIKADQKAAEERAKKEAELEKKRMTKADFDRQNAGKNSPSQKAPTGGASKVQRIDTEGISGGVTGGSTANKKGGAGGTAMTREEADLLDAYISIILQRLREAHEKPEGLSDLLQARVQFRINLDGSITGVSIVQSSGDRLFDESVKDAFRKMRRIGPPPNGKADTYVVWFKMKDDE